MFHFFISKMWYAGSSFSFESVYSVLEYNNLLIKQAGLWAFFPNPCLTLFYFCGRSLYEGGLWFACKIVEVSVLCYCDCLLKIASHHIFCQPRKEIWTNQARILGPCLFTNIFIFYFWFYCVCVLNKDIYQTE